MKTPLTSPFCARVRYVAPPARSWSGLALGLSLGCTPLLCAPFVQAQTAPDALAPAPVSGAPVPATPDISVLIVALDDLAASSAPASAFPNAPIAPPTFAPVLPGAVAPIVPADGQPAVVTPAGFAGQKWQWRASAQEKPKAQKEPKAPKKSKAQKKAEDQAEIERFFNLDPAAPTLYKPGAAPAPAPNVIVPGVTGQPVGQPPIVRAPGAPMLFDDTPLGGKPLDAPLTPRATGTPGRSQLVAVPLRRALLAQGYKDVQVVTPESATIVRALGEGRLTQRVLDELKRAMATLAANNAAGAPADVSATIAAGRAASRIGQATGYRGVVAFTVGEPSAIEVVGVGAGAQTEKVNANMVVADAQRESVEPLQLVATGDNEGIWRETGAAEGARLLDSTLRDWPASSSENRAPLALVHYNAARAAYDRGDFARAQDELNQSLALDGSRPQTFLLRGDILNAIDPGNGYTAYQRAVELNSSSGQDWARIASAYAYAQTPDWRAAWDAGKRALALNYDSAALRVAMATAQYGRAEQFRKYDYQGKAEEAEIDARANLERALQLAPDDPTAVRLLAKNLLEKRRFEEAARTLDRIAPRYPKDLDIQSQYAVALGNQVGREEDAFAAYSRVWKLSNQRNVAIDPLTYRTLAQGFDNRLFNLGKVAVQLSRGVASRAILRETALLQLTKLKEEMDDAQSAVAIMQPSGAVGATAVQSRIFAANLMDQALESFQTYLETGQADYFTRGDGLYRQAVAQLNTARSTQ